ncbi:MAG: DUF11 domain-containing protein, partial [Sphingomonadaceae bacterium]|nr:DUF11 domain-containing protein [Sphingomonadaceae bacterium]
MALFTRLCGALSCALGAALLALGAPAPARAQAAPEAVRTIANTAQVEWDQAGQHQQLASNEVDINVDVRSFTLTAYQFGSGAGSQALTANAPLCAGSAGPVPVALGAGWGSESLAPATVVPTNQVHAGEPLFFVLDYPAGNTDPNKIDTVTGVIFTSSGDRETLTVSETGPNTGKFAGYIQTVAEKSPPGDCVLGLVPGDTIFVQGMRGGTQYPFITAQLSAFFDPNGIVFDSTDGSPVSGAHLTLIDVATGLPAKVFGDDSASSFPSSIVSGGSEADSSGTKYQSSAGAYRFPLVPPGHYRIAVDPPPGYHAPSVRTPAELDLLVGPDGQPYQVTDASFGAPFAILGPNEVRVEIPLDRIGQPIQISKSADRREASPGDTVGYMVTVRNPDPKVATTTITLTDHIPPGMRLRAGATRVNNQPVQPRMAPDGRSFDVDVPPLAPGASALVTYAMEVLGTANEGDMVNLVDGHDGKGNVGNVANAVVRIRRDLIADRVTIEGRVTDGGCSAPGPSTS